MSFKTQAQDDILTVGSSELSSSSTVARTSLAAHRVRYSIQCTMPQTALEIVLSLSLLGQSLRWSVTRVNQFWIVHILEHLFVTVGCVF